MDHELELVIMSYSAERELKIKSGLTSLLLQKKLLLKHDIFFQIKNRISKFPMKQGCKKKIQQMFNLNIELFILSAL